MELPDYKTFIHNKHVTSEVHAIRRFNYSVRYHPNGSLAKPSLSEKLLDSCLECIEQSLVNSGIHSLHELKATVQRVSPTNETLDIDKPIISIVLPDSRTGFSVNIYDDRMSFIRDASSFADFYEWYIKFMPQSSFIEETTRRTVDATTDLKLRVVETQYEFQVIFSDFTSTKKSDQARNHRNVDVLEQLVPLVPGPNGKTPLPNADFFRIDLTLSRLEHFADTLHPRYRNCWYILEAPFNELGRFLVLRAQMRNVSHELPTQAEDASYPITQPFDEDFTTDYVIALQDFFRDRALEQFMGTLLDTWTFETQRQL